MTNGHLSTLIQRLTAQRDELSIVIGWLERQPKKANAHTPKPKAPKQHRRKWTRAQRAHMSAIMARRMKALWAAKRAAASASEPATIETNSTL